MTKKTKNVVTVKAKSSNVQDIANTAKTATTVAKTATEQVKRPTVKSLQQEVANLTEQLMYANKLAVNLEIDLNREKSESSRYQNQYLNEVSKTSQLTSKINDLENRSILTQIMFKLCKPFR